MFRNSLLSCFALVALSGILRADPPKDRAEQVKYARDRAKSSNNLKQIALAFHNHHDAFGTCPQDIVDKDGKPLLSWRVAILPFIEQNQLNEEFKLDEPWNSDNNKKLLEKMPKTFAPVRGKAEKGMTFYQSFAGDGAVMGTKKVRFADITDGTSNTIAVIEAGEAVEWTKPSDIAYDAKKPLPKLGGLFDGDFNVAFCDGSVRFLKKGIKEETLKQFITIGGGEVVDVKDLEPAK